MDESRLLKHLWKNEYYRRSLVNYMTKGYFLQDRRHTIRSIYNLIRNNLHRDDCEIFRLVRDVLDAYPRESRASERSTERADTVLRIIGQKPVRKYLDFGCGDGSITHQIGQRLGLKPHQIYGIDIHHIDNPNITYLSSDEKTIEKLGEETFDLITAFVSLHHISEYRKTIDMIRRLLAPGGVLVIREHDSEPWDTVDGPLLPLFLNLIHAWVCVKRFETYDATKLYTGIDYATHEGWSDLFEEYGLRLIYREKYLNNNPQQLYYAVYTKFGDTKKK